MKKRELNNVVLSETRTKKPFYGMVKTDTFHRSLYKLKDMASKNFPNQDMGQEKLYPQATNTGRHIVNQSLDHVYLTRRS